MTFRGVKHVAISSIDYHHVPCLICGVCHKERVYKIPLHHAKMSVKHSTICYLSLRSLRGCDKWHLYIFIDKITRLICYAYRAIYLGHALA